MHVGHRSRHERLCGVDDNERRAVGELDIFGVPTFVVHDAAVFVRLMSRPAGDVALAQRTVQGVLDLFDTMPDLNEFKYTKLSF